MAEAALEAIARAKAIAAKLNASMDTGRKRGRWDNEPGKESEPQRTLHARRLICVLFGPVCVYVPHHRGGEEAKEDLHPPEQPRHQLHGPAHRSAGLDAEAHGGAIGRSHPDPRYEANMA